MKIVITVVGESVKIEINSQQLELPLFEPPKQDIDDKPVAPKHTSSVLADMELKDYDRKTTTFKGAGKPLTPFPVQKHVMGIRKAEEAEMTETLNARRKTFLDPWDCGMCRNAGSLCTLHEGLESEGKKALKYRHWGASKGAHHDNN